MPKSKKNEAAKLKAKALKKRKAAQKAAKTELKTRSKTGERIDTEDDLLRTLEELRLADEANTKVTIQVVDGPPTRRANATFISCPVSNALYFFGGELFDGRVATFFNDLFRYDCDKKEWKRITSPNAPAPRSALQMVASPAEGGQIWVFGGEFSSQNQSTFFHFRDLWKFDIATNTWDCFDTKIRPSARSGHRMTLWKHFLVLFGGFHDTGIRTNYLQDLWLFDLNEYCWKEVVQKDVDRRPRARSGFSFLPCADGVILHGGYCKDYSSKRAKGVALNDTWLLRLEDVKSGVSFSSADVKWEKRKKVGYAPSIRSGATASVWSSRQLGVLFGGVMDEDVDEENMRSVFFNDGLYAYQLTGNGRWISLNLKKAKGEKNRRRAKAVLPNADHGKSDSESEGEDAEPLEQTAQVNASSAVIVQAPVEPEEDVTIPCKRYNAMLAIQRNILYLYGGIIETQDQEATLDDFWSLDLSKMDEWHCLKQSELVWNDEENEGNDEIEIKDESESDTDDESDSTEHDHDGDVAEDTKIGVAEQEVAREDAEKLKLREQANAFLAASKADSEAAREDRLSTPLPGDSLRSFYDRTREIWTHKAYAVSDNRGKLLRRDGFQMAEEKYDEYRPILEEIQRIQASAALDQSELQHRDGSAGLRDVDNRNRR